MPNTRTAESGHQDTPTLLGLTADGICAHTGYPHAAVEGCPPALRMVSAIAVIVMLAGEVGRQHKSMGRPFTLPGTELSDAAYEHGYWYPTHTDCSCGLALPDGTLVWARSGMRTGNTVAARGDVSLWDVFPPGEGCPCGVLALPPHAASECADVSATAHALAEHEAGTLRDSVRAVAVPQGFTDAEEYEAYLDACERASVEREALRSGLHGLAPVS